MRRRSRRGPALALLLLATLAGCGPSRVEWQPRATAGEGAYAVAWTGATFRTRPDLRAPTVLLGSGSASPWGRSGFAAFRVRRSRGAWIELESLGAPAAEHCAGGVEGLEPFQLLLYANEAALVPVTTREVSQRFEDGTSIALGRGVPLDALAGAQVYRLRLGGAGTVVRLAARDVGTRYLPNPDRSDPPPIGAIDPEAVAAGALALGSAGRIDAERPVALDVHASEPRGSELLVELRSSCGVIRARVPPHVMRTPAQMTVSPSGLDGRADEELGVTRPASDPEAIDVPPPPGAESSGAAASSSGAAGPETTGATPPPPSGADAPPPAPSRTARAGAAIFWPDDRAAGAAATDAPLGPEVERSPGGRRCFAQRLGSAPAPTVLCFEARDVAGQGEGRAVALDPPA